MLITPIKPSLRTDAREETILEDNLTSHEVHGLLSRFCLADGHAYHEMHPELVRVLRDATKVWKYTETRSIPELETDFVASFASLIGSPILASHPFRSLLPTASNSIDTVAAFLRSHSMRVGLMEPVFDNLHLILKRREVEIVAVPEHVFTDLEKLQETVQKSRLQALFMVNPNNPTGMQLSAVQFRQLADFCAKAGVLLVIDRTFRLYHSEPIDDYRELVESGCDFVVIEDTGKTWATQDLKVSLMVYSERIARECRLLYEEIYLCTSKFSLALLARIIETTQRLGISEALLDEVERRRRRVASCIRGSSLSIVGEAGRARLPFLWIDCAATSMDDLDIVRALLRWDVSVLPGRYFYWNSQDTHTHFIRISLMRPSRMFLLGVEQIARAFREIFPDGSHGGSCGTVSPTPSRTSTAVVTSLDAAA